MKHITIFLLLCVLEGCSLFRVGGPTPPSEIHNNYYRYYFANNCKVEVSIIPASPLPSLANKLKLKSNQHVYIKLPIRDEKMKVKTIGKDGEEIAGIVAYNQVLPLTRLYHNGNYEIYCTSFCGENLGNIDSLCTGKKASQYQLFDPTSN